MPRALITGITGQDGTYLAALLARRGYEVHGLIRSAARASAVAPLPSGTAPILHVADLGDATAVMRAVHAANPDELYHLAGHTQVGTSFHNPTAVCDATAMGTLRLLEAFRSLPHPAKFFHASTSQIFGKPTVEPQDESTPACPVNPYGAAKAFATHLVRIYRDVHGCFAVNGICYNHESPLRGPEFVTGKICRAAAAIRAGRQSRLTLGDTSAQRDWGDARDFVEGFWRSLQHSSPDDYIFATGILHSVQHIVEMAFEAVGLDWRGRVDIDDSLRRPAEATRLVGDPAKARRILGWTPKATLRDLIAEMTATALRDLQSPPPGAASPAQA